ncbi:MAG: hypothetical protein LC796_07815 [Acidobacteria bacterium]|nr:hypothetical protein [Acidobacteriota bacterium]MCA1609802.1 hypothetical protein [Acidobacteriota bacterium]
MKRRIAHWISGLGALVLVSAGCVGTVSGPYDDPSPYGHPYYPPRTQDYGYAREQFARLAHELDDRAARAHRIAERRSASYGGREQEFFGRIHHFSDEAREFHDRYENGDIQTRQDLRASMNELIRDAQATDRAMREANVFPEVWNEWTGVIAVLQRMIDMVRA